MKRCRHGILPNDRFGCPACMERRERIATAVLAGIMANSGGDPRTTFVDAARWAIGHADALIERLDAAPKDGTPAEAPLTD